MMKKIKKFIGSIDAEIMLGASYLSGLILSVILKENLFETNMAIKASIYMLAARVVMKNFL